MCAVSNVGDQFGPSYWPKKYPEIFPSPNTPSPNIANLERKLEEIRTELEALKDLLKAAKVFDEKTGQKDCEMDEKVHFLRDLAKRMNVDFSDVFPEGTAG